MRGRGMLVCSAAVILLTCVALGACAGPQAPGARAAQGPAGSTPASTSASATDVAHGGYPDALQSTADYPSIPLDAALSKAATDVTLPTGAGIGQPVRVIVLPGDPGRPASATGRGNVGLAAEYASGLRVWVIPGDDFDADAAVARRSGSWEDTATSQARIVDVNGHRAFFCPGGFQIGSHDGRVPVSPVVAWKAGDLLYRITGPSADGVLAAARSTR